MSWIRVQSTRGYRLQAPCFSQPPTLEGFDKLFSSPLQMRSLHAFSHDTDGSGVPQEVVVLFDRVDVGGLFGEVAIAAGATESSRASLEVLLRSAITALQSTTWSSAQLILDSLCTLAPTVPVTTIDVLENDGLIQYETDGCSRYHMRTIAAHGDAHLPYMHDRIGGRSNHCYLKALLVGSEPTLHFSGPSHCANAGDTDGSMATSPGLSCASASLRSDEVRGHHLCARYCHTLRRNGVLFFVEQDVVPVSLTYCTLTRGRKRVLLKQTPSRKEITADVSCISPLHSKELLRHRYWSLMGDEASTCTQMVWDATLRMMYEACPSQAVLLLQTLETSEVPLTNGPLAAAFSASGLLFASPIFYKHITHADRLVLAAVAVDRLTRSTASLQPQLNASDATSISALHYCDFSLVCAASGDATSAAGATGSLYDFFALSVGDAVTVLLGFPRTAAHQQKPNDAIECLRSYTQRSTQTPTAASSKGIDPPYLQHCINVCCNSLKPFTSRFYESLLVVTLARSTGDSVCQGTKPITKPPVVIHGTEGVLHTHNGIATAAANSPDTRTVPSKLDRLRLLCCLPFAVGSKHSRKRENQLVALQHRAEVTRQLLPPLFGAPAVPTSDAEEQHAAYFLSLPLHSMWCYVASQVTRADLQCFRHLESLGVHSVFWVQRVGLATNGGRHAMSSEQYVLGYYRPHLQQRNRGGCLESSDDSGIVHTPSLTLSRLSDSKISPTRKTVSNDDMCSWCSWIPRGMIGKAKLKDLESASHAQVTVMPQDLLDAMVPESVLGAATAEPIRDRMDSSSRDECSDDDDDDCEEGSLVTTFQLQRKCILKHSKHSVGAPLAETPDIENDAAFATPMRRHHEERGTSPSRGSNEAVFVVTQKVVSINGDATHMELPIIQTLQRGKCPTIDNDMQRSTDGPVPLKEVCQELVYLQVAADAVLGSVCTV